MILLPISNTYYIMSYISGSFCLIMYTKPGIMLFFGCVAVFHLYYFFPFLVYCWYQYGIGLLSLDIKYIIIHFYFLRNQQLYRFSSSMYQCLPKVNILICFVHYFSGYSNNNPLVTLHIQLHQFSVFSSFCSSFNGISL